MKKIYNKWIVVMSICLLTVVANAQHKPDFKAPWVSNMGYWVLESNIHAPRHHVVRFYNNENLLVYTETLDGIRLNPGKRKVKMNLKKALETSILAWEKTRQTATNKNYVKNLVK